jgi:hypothetical protein
MDMKKILQAVDGAVSKPVEGVDSMAKFIRVVNESKSPLNRLTTAESMTMNHYTPESTKPSITSPVLNIAKDAKPSMIGKYFKNVETEFAEGVARHKDRTRHLAERAIERVTGKSVSRSSDAIDLPDQDIDTITVDVPLLMRLLEYAREDATDDMALHDLTQNLIKFSKEYDTLSMDHYDGIVGDQPALPAPDKNNNGKEDY